MHIARTQYTYVPTYRENLVIVISWKMSLLAIRMKHLCDVYL